jgi:hypothetical protein
MFMDGPAVSLNGSPTVSPTTAALWASEPLPPRLPSSIHFLALSQAPPPLNIIRPRTTPVRVAPARKPPRDAGPSTKPTRKGTSTARTPGTIISFKAASVAMATQRAESGRAFPSISPSVSLNWRRISLTIFQAARPTASMVTDERKKGISPPMKKPTTTGAETRSRVNPCMPGRFLTVAA